MIMNNYRNGILSLIICLTIGLLCSAQSFTECNLINQSTANGEQITYKVYYTLAGAWIGAGQATFTNKLEKYQGKPVYHITGDGKTFRSYDWFFKVRDKYESYIDTASMMPMKFVRRVNEGGYQKFNIVNFNRNLQTSSTFEFLISEQFSLKESPIINTFALLLLIFLFLEGKLYHLLLLPYTNYEI